MKDKHFNLIWNEAINSDDRAAFISEWSISSIWGDQDDDGIAKTAGQIGKIWDVAHMTVRDLCNRAGIGQTEMSRKFCIPLRTVQNWCGRQNQCPSYVILMMARLLGMI